MKDSLAADARAQQLDPDVLTSVAYTHLVPLSDTDHARGFADAAEPELLTMTLLQQNQLSEARRLLADLRASPNVEA